MKQVFQSKWQRDFLLFLMLSVDSSFILKNVLKQSIIAFYENPRQFVILNGRNVLIVKKKMPLEENLFKQFFQH
jgi:hypothetical protein